MQNIQPSLFTRDDTFFGVCEGLGQDLGIHPNILRLALTAPLFFYPVQTIGAYLATGILVLLTRIVFPNPPQAAAEQAEAASLVPTAAPPEVMEEAERVALAA